MSEKIAVLNKTGKKNADLDIVEFSGGREKGKMLQITQGNAWLLGNPDEPGFIQLTIRDAALLRKELDKWLRAKGKLFEEV